MALAGDATDPPLVPDRRQRGARSLVTLILRSLHGLRLHLRVHIRALREALCSGVPGSYRPPRFMVSLTFPPFIWPTKLGMVGTAKVRLIFAALLVRNLTPNVVAGDRLLVC